MLKIENQKIYLTRGDNAQITVTVTDANGVPISFPDSAEYAIYLTVKRDIDDTTAVISKSATNANVISFMPADTKDLEFGRYVYDIELHYQNEVHTIIEPHTFTIGEEVRTSGT